MFTRTKTEAILPPAVPALEFGSPPSALFVRVEEKTYESFCGVVCDARHDPVFVAVTRNKAANSNVGYTVPALSYLTTSLSRHKDVTRANLKWRLPADDAELRSLVEALSLKTSRVQNQAAADLSQPQQA